MLIGLTISPQSTLIEDGKWLVRRTISMYDYYKHTKKEEYNGGAKGMTTSSVGSPNIFLSKFVEIFKENKYDFCRSYSFRYFKSSVITPLNWPSKTIL